MSAVDGHTNLKFIKSGSWVLITGLILLNGKEKTLTLPYTSQDGKWYAPVIGIGSDVKNVSAYGFCYVAPNSKSMSVYMNASNTYAAINMRYLTSD